MARCSSNRTSARPSFDAIMARILARSSPAEAPTSARTEGSPTSRPSFEVGGEQPLDDDVLLALLTGQQDQPMAPWLSSHPVRQPLRGAAAPANPDMYGYISELHGYGMAAEASGEQAEDLAATMLASTLGLDFDPEAAERAQTDLRTTAA